MVYLSSLSAPLHQELRSGTNSKQQYQGPISIIHIQVRHGLFSLFYCNAFCITKRLTYSWLQSLVIGTQRADGLFGPFVIRQPKSMDVHGSLYDYDLPEHVIIATDWIHESGSMKYLSHYHGTGNNKPDNILINGLGKYRKFEVGKKGITYTPLARFNVVKVIHSLFYHSYDIMALIILTQLFIEGTIKCIINSSQISTT